MLKFAKVMDNITSGSCDGAAYALKQRYILQKVLKSIVLQIKILIREMHQRERSKPNTDFIFKWR